MNRTMEGGVKTFHQSIEERETDREGEREMGVR